MTVRTRDEEQASIRVAFKADSKSATPAERSVMFTRSEVPVKSLSVMQSKSGVVRPRKKKP